MKIFDLLNEILDELNRSRKQRFGASKTIDAEVVISILQEIRQAIPNEIVEAQMIVENRQRILTQAQEQADDIVAAAKEQVKGTVDSHRLTRLAYEKSDKIVKEAKQEAYKVRVAANDYAVEVIEDITAYLDEYRSIVQENKTNFLNRIHRESEEL